MQESNSGISHESPGVLIINWKKKAMLGEAVVTIFVDNEPVNMVFFAHDSKTVLPLSKGLHQIRAALGFRNAEIRIDICAGQYTELDLDYSRSAGSVKFNNLRISGSADYYSMSQIIHEASGKRNLMQAVISYTNQGYQVLSLTNTQAVILMNKITRGMLGIVPAAINAATQKTIIELHPDGTISSSVDAKNDAPAQSASAVTHNVSSINGIWESTNGEKCEFRNDGTLLLGGENYRYKLIGSYMEITTETE